jgi:hypothetical protein
MRDKQRNRSATPRSFFEQTPPRRLQFAHFCAGRPLLAIAPEINEVMQQSSFGNQFGLWLSLVERLVRDQEAVGSNPTSPIALPFDLYSRLEERVEIEPASCLDRQSPNAKTYGFAEKKTKSKNFKA